MASVGSIIGSLGIIPVAVIHNSVVAEPLAAALRDGGLPCVEVTFRTDAAVASIKAIASEFSDVLVGAGTVLSVDQAKYAIEAGAHFIVAPGFDAEVVDYCMDKGIDVFPGCATATEVTQAYKRGLRVVKFFPCGELGGLSAIKALGAPFAGLRFMPTGGINAQNVAEYLADKRVFACGGSWVAPASLMMSGDFAEIERRAREASTIARSVRG